MTKLQQFADLLEKDQARGLLDQHPDWKLGMPLVRTIKRRKYTLVDIAPCPDQWSGKYMVENDTGRIYGVKGYGKVHKGHYFGTLDTIHDLDWSSWYPSMKLNRKEKE